MILALELNISVPFLCKDNYDYKIILKFSYRKSYIKSKYFIEAKSILVIYRISKSKDIIFLLKPYLN